MRDIIKIVSSGKTKAGNKTGTLRTTTKNKRKTTNKLAFKSYDKLAYNTATDKLGMHVLFEEAKI